METKLVLLIAFQLCLTCNLSLSAEGKTAKEVLQRPTAYSELRTGLLENLKKMETVVFENRAQKVEGKKSIAKSILFSAVVPGAGQLYSESYLKAGAFLLLEVAAIWGQVHYNSEANKLEDRFEALADKEWSEDAYWDWIAEISAGDRNNLVALREWERLNFSHFLPEDINQQYYENVGKYNQFIMGWRDFREDILGTEIFTMDIYKDGEFKNQDLRTISPTRNIYVNIRKDSNDNFKRTTTFATVTLFNHMLSAIDAGFTTRRFNRRISANINIHGMLYQNKIVPAIILGVTW